MLDQSFSTKSLLRLINLKDIVKYKLGRNKSEYENELSLISEKISSPDFKIENIKSFKIGKNTAYTTETAEEYLALKKISDSMARIYKIKLKTRDDISDQLSKITQHTNEFSIIRGDIKKFYDSINYNDVLNKLKNDSLLSQKSISILESLCSIPGTGLPRGLSVSAIMSEIYIRSFDQFIEKNSNVYFYARYVDDFIAITSGNVDYIKNNIEKFLQSELNLKLNHKTRIIQINRAEENTSNIEEKKFTFLGYEYQIKNLIFNEKRTVRITPSQAKINKIKSRIIYSFLDLENNKRNNQENIDIFRMRLKLLSGNYIIKSSKDTETKLKSGIYYTNKITNDPNEFLKINRFLISLIHCKKNNRLGKIIKKFDDQLKREVISTDFKAGFTERKIYEFSVEQISTIKDCWRRRM